MKSSKAKWVTKAAGMSVLALVLATPSFAQSRDDRRGNNNNSNTDRRQTEVTRPAQRGSNGAYRDNQRISAEGRIASFAKERDGYRVRLDQGRDSYYVPSSYFGRGRNPRVGLSIRLGGVFRSGSIYVDAVNWPNDGYGNGNGNGYNNNFVSGVVERVDVRNDRLWLRDNRGGDLFAVEMQSGGRNSRVDVRDLRPGDYVELSGGWLRGGIFAADRIESVRSGRY